MRGKNRIQPENLEMSEWKSHYSLFFYWLTTEYTQYNYSCKLTIKVNSNFIDLVTDCHPHPPHLLMTSRCTCAIIPPPTDRVSTIIIIIFSRTSTKILPILSNTILTTITHHQFLWWWGNKGVVFVLNQQTMMTLSSRKKLQTYTTISLMFTNKLFE